MTTPPVEVWEPPGPGSWICDRSHTSPGPTPLYQRIVSEETEPVYRRAMQRYGGAIGSIDMQFVNGALYRRLVPLVAPRFDRGKMPPNPVLWLVTRVHPEFRRRERTAAKVLAEQSFLDDIHHWTTTERFEWIDRNRSLQSIDLDRLDDAGLADHLRSLDQLLLDGWRRHHELHSNDLGPIGDLLAHAQQWNIDTTAVMGLLLGSSPATAHAALHGHAMADALRRGAVEPDTVRSLNDIRAVPDAAAALDTYLDLFGWRLISDYDIEGLTLHELPSAVVALVRAAADPPPVAEADDHVRPGVAEQQAKLAAQADDPALFDELLGSAREAYGVRDDNGPLTWAWPAGLTRRAYLEAGRRLAASGRITQDAHVFELDVGELATVLDAGPSPTAAELEARAEARRWQSTLTAPDTLGPPAVEPDLAPLPPAIRRVMGIVLAAVTMIDPEDGVSRDADPATAATDGRMAGLGIGAEPYRGTARVADDAAKAIAEMAPGDVLVAPWTAPSFNAVLTIAGALVVQEGGLLCHAAVMARELDIPAVVGCAGAMSQIKGGDIIEVDPAAGTVRVIEAAVPPSDA